jgi:hypothetical protein
MFLIGLGLSENGGIPQNCQFHDEWWTSELEGNLLAHKPIVYHPPANIEHRCGKLHIGSFSLGNHGFSASMLVYPRVSILYIYMVSIIYIYITHIYIYITHIYITYCTTLDSAQHRAGTVATDPTAPCRPDGTVGLGPSHQVFALPWLFQFVAHHLADRDQIWKHENLPWHIF